MAWAVTLIVKDCGNSSPISGALVSDGYGGGYTDGYGQFIAVIDDAYTGYVVQVSHAGYTPRNFTFDRSQTGTPQNTCLTVSAATGGGSGTGTGNTGGGIKCFIVTAASGSEESPEVAGMRVLREAVAARAPLAGALIDAIYREYWQFSPGVADQIRTSDAARLSVMTLVVKPLFAWFQLAGQLALAPADREAAARAERALRAACPRYLGPARVANYLRQLRDDSAVPASMPALVAQLAPGLNQALGLPLVRWAVLDPLLRAWQCAADGREGRGEVARWLAAAPLDTLPAPGPGGFAGLGSLLAFDDGARAVLAGRLEAAWPGAGATRHLASVADADA